MSQESSKHTINAINSLLESVVAQGVALLAETYNFDAADAMAALKLGGIIDIPEFVEQPSNQRVNKTASKTVNKPIKTANMSPTLPLPWCGQIVDTWCHALRVNHNLFSQCTNQIEVAGENQSYCTTCWSNYATKQEFRYGTVEDRTRAQNDCGNTVDFVHNPDSDKAKKALPYANIMAKKSPPITREAAETEAARFGLTIPEEQFVFRVPPKRGRPSAKVTVTPIDRTFAPPSRDHALSPELDLESAVKDNDANDNDANEVDVEEFTFEDKLYYRGTEGGMMYDPETSAAIGRWDDNLNAILPI
jgi:hypothetical protein